jgi:hypothetical protein
MPDEMVVVVPADKLDEAKRRLANHKFTVVETSIPMEINTVADLLGANQDGWPFNIVIPYRGGKYLTVPVKIRHSAAIGRAVREATMRMIQEITKVQEVIGVDKELTGSDVDGADDEEDEDIESGPSFKVHEALNPKAAPDLTPEQATSHAAEIEAISDRYAGRLFDSGILASWDESVMGMPLTRESFIRVWRLGYDGNRFGDQLGKRFSELNKPREEAMQRELKASSPARNGTDVSADSATTSGPSN